MSRPLELGCRKKEDPEYWVVESEEDITKTVKGDVDLEDGRAF